MKFSLKPKRNGTSVQFLCRLSHAHIDEPYSFSDEDKDKKYSARLLVDKEDTETMKVIAEAVAEARRQGEITKWKGNSKGKISLPVLDGDVPNEDTGETQPENEGNYYINSKSKHPVQVFNRALQEVSPAEVYSGCWAVVSVNFYPYLIGSKKGVGTGLNAMVKYADDERFGGTPDRRRDFDGFDFGEQDQSMNLLGLDDM